MIGLGLSLTRAALPQAFAELNLLSATLDPRITFTRASTKAYVGSDGLLHTAGVNECPLEYDPVTLLPVGRSFWEARTNLLLNSDTPATQGVTVTAQSYTLSFTGTGTVALSGAYTGSKTGTGTGPANRVSMTFTPTAGTLTVTPSGSVQNFQIEAGGNASPYIPTTSAQVARAADVATVNDLSTLRFNTAQGTLYVETFMPMTARFTEWVNFSDHLSGAATYFYAIESSSAGTTPRFAFGGSSSPGNVQANGGAQSLGAPLKAAAAYAGASLSFVANGGAVGTASMAGADARSVAYLHIGELGGGNYANTLIRRIRYYPRALSGAQLQAITA